MIMNYGSFAYILSIVVLIVLVIGIYIILKNKSIKTKKIVFFVLAFVNLIQHLFKGLIWPHLTYTFLDYNSSASNLCAFLIIIMPFVYLSKSSLWKDFVTYFGINGGIVAIAVPYWFIGESIISWEYLRFYFCHSLLLITGIFPVMFGLHKLSFKNFWKVGFIFGLSLMLVLFNIIIFASMGYFGDVKNLYDILYTQNPTWSMHPTDVFESFVSIIDFFTPDIFMNVSENRYVPILWYFIPLYLLISIIAFVITIILDKEGFSKFTNKIKKIFIKDKNASNT